MSLDQVKVRMGVIGLPCILAANLIPGDQVRFGDGAEGIILAIDRTWTQFLPIGRPAGAAPKRRLTGAIFQARFSALRNLPDAWQEVKFEGAEFFEARVLNEGMRLLRARGEVLAPLPTAEAVREGGAE